MSDTLADLSREGVSIWLDDLSRKRLVNGTLADLAAHDHVVGVTTNPTIFAKAITGSDAYADQARDLRERGVGVGEALRAMTAFDVRWACDVLRPVYEATGGVDGRVSIEVDPRLAYDTAATIAAARFLWWLVDRPNLFIKIPAARQGLPAIAACLAEGISINITLIFSLARYDEVMDAFLDGMERARQAGHDLRSLASVASFFVSRVDTEVDARLDKIGTPEAAALRGRAAIANARLAYQRYEAMIASPRWAALAAAGARPQRPLWASTSVKDPAYPDTRYVTDLVAPGVSQHYAGGHPACGRRPRGHPSGLGARALCRGAARADRAGRGRRGLRRRDGVPGRPRFGHLRRQLAGAGRPARGPATAPGRTSGRTGELSMSESPAYVIAGASLAGAKAAETLRLEGFHHPIVLIGEETERPYERPPLSKDYLLGKAERDVIYVHPEQWYAEHDIDLRFGVQVAEITGAGGRASGVRLGDGSQVAGDVIIVGVGITPNTHLAEQAGLEVGNGVVVDAGLRSSDPDVYAAGDVACAYHPGLGRHIRVEHWANALNQPQAAARAMLGQEVAYDRVPYFFTDQYDLGMEYAGYVEPGGYDQVVFRGDVAGREFVTFWLADGRVLAGMNVNVWDVNAAIQDLVRSGRTVDADQLADPGVPLEAFLDNGP